MRELFCFMLGISDLEMGRFGHVMDWLVRDGIVLCSKPAIWKWDV